MSAKNTKSLRRDTPSTINAIPCVLSVGWTNIDTLAELSQLSFAESSYTETINSFLLIEEQSVKYFNYGVSYGCTGTTNVETKTAGGSNPRMLK
jgi:hypothetical protein